MLGLLGPGLCSFFLPWILASALLSLPGELSLLFSTGYWEEVFPVSPVSPEVMIYVEGMPSSYRGPSLVSRALLSSVALQTPQVSSVLEEEAGADSRFPDFVLLRPASSSGISWSGPVESTSSVPRTHRTLIPVRHSR